MNSLLGVLALAVAFLDAGEPPVRASDRRVATHIAAGIASRRTVLSGRTVWPAGSRVALRGHVQVAADAELTIEAGVVVEAFDGASLIVERGGRLNVHGTQTEPVVLTCPDSAKVPGCWSGLTILGNAPINHGTLTSPAGGRGGAGNCRESTLDGAMYGGCTADDSSGVLQFVRIQYATEGLRIYGVGNRTILRDIQVHRSIGHGLEVVGGTAQFRDLALTTNAQYGLAYSGGWTGQAQYVVIQQDVTGYAGGVLGRNAVGAGGNQNAAPRSAPVLANVTIVTPPSAAGNPYVSTSPAALRFDRGAAGTFYNMLLIQPSIGVDVDDAATCAQVAGGALALRGVGLTAPVAATDPDTDPAECATLGEASLLTGATTVTGVAGTSQLKSATNVVLPDLRPVANSSIAAAVGVAPPATGLLEAVTFLGALREETSGVIPWYSGWTLGEQLAAPALVTMSGTLSGTGRGGLADVVVRVDPIGLTATTDAFGAFVVTGVPAGPVELVLPSGATTGCDGASVLRTRASATERANVQVTCASIGPLPSEYTVATGDQHSCGISAAGSTYCWGNNGGGRLGDGTGTNRNAPTVVTGGIAFVSVTAGLSHTCGLTGVGEAYCWGDNAFGQLGDGTTTGRAAPSRVVGGQLFKSLVAGVSHTCGLTSGGGAYCWGLNSSGQVGDGSLTNRLYPKSVPSVAFTMMTAGWFHTCGRTSAGGVYCWGGNAVGQLGTGNTTAQLAPAPVSGTETFSTVSAGAQHTCALANAGQAYCWGLNNSGQLGDGSTVARAVPTAVDGGLGFAAIAAGYYHTCGVGPQKQLYCWGWNAHGQVGDESTVDRRTPVEVTDGVQFVAIARGGGYHTCGMQIDGLVSCWGQNTFGQLGDGSNELRRTPTIAAGGIAIFALAANAESTCGLTASGAAFCWGDGQSIGDGTFGQKSVPTAVAGGIQFSEISGTRSGSHFCGLTSTGTAYCWGRNVEGQLGDGTIVSRSSPTPVSGGLAFSSLAGVFGQGTCGLRTSGMAYCWGNPGGSGVLGDSTIQLRSTPGAVSGGFIFSSIAGGGDHVCARTAVGRSTYCWGDNRSGEVGDGTFGNANASRLTPTAVTGGLSFASLALGNSHSCGLTAAGVAYCWGLNARGQLGDGTLGNTSLNNAQPTPTLVQGNLAFTQLVGGAEFTCGLTVNGAGYCWGRNAFGVLGNGTFDDALVPVPILGSRSLLRLTAGNSHACGSTETGAVFCWGWGVVGQLGGGGVSNSSRSRPAQVRTGIAFRLP